MTFMLKQVTKASPLALAACLLALTACGGGGGGVASTPTPPPIALPPPPSPSPAGSAAVFFDAPATSQEFAAFNSGDNLRIRYDAQTRNYEVMAPGTAWEHLYGYPTFSPGEYHIPGPMDDLGVVLARTRPDHPDPALRYRYSSLASWTRGYPDDPDATSGIIAFGTATPAGGLPLTGSASYAGQIEGTANFSIYALNGFAGWERAPIGGSVSMQFDFGNGSLTGEIRPTVDCDCGVSLPALSFADTVFAAGSQSYSGRFATGISGPNAFSGIFTGPHGEELIGQWAFPLIFDGAARSAEGVWVAKQGN